MAYMISCLDKKCYDFSYFRPEKECPELPDPDNGQVHISGRHFQVSADMSRLRSVSIV